MLLNASNLTAHYAGRSSAALRDISLSLAAGQIVMLVGPNGSGKSTLLRCLLGDLRSASKITWDDRPLAKWSRRDLAKRVAYLPQSPTAEPQSRVIDVLLLGRSAHWGAFGIESPSDATVIADVASRLNLTDWLTRPIDDLSGGERQRVFIGRCLAQQPAAVLLDEPGTFLDLKHQLEMLQLLRSLAREQGLGVLMASHDLYLAATFADQVIVLRDGQALAAGPPRDVLTPATLRTAFDCELDRFDRPDGSFVLTPRPPAAAAR